MPVTDPIADMLTRIRNANAIAAEEVSIPASRVKVGIAKILREEGFIKHYKVSRVRKKGQKGRKSPDQEKGNPLEQQSEIRVFLKYGPNDEKVIQGLQRLSKPSLRRYVRSGEIPRVEGGLGVSIVSTSQGLKTDKQCRQENIGGELLCKIW
ncbi:MAG: 30S ribosomal protein S8 [Candidatus Sumerlaeota bacterium]